MTTTRNLDSILEVAHLLRAKNLALALLDFDAAAAELATLRADAACGQLLNELAQHYLNVLVRPGVAHRKIIIDLDDTRVVVVDRTVFDTLVKAKTEWSVAPAGPPPKLATGPDDPPKVTP